MKREYKLESGNDCIVIIPEYEAPTINNVHVRVKHDFLGKEIWLNQLEGSDLVSSVGSYDAMKIMEIAAEAWFNKYINFVAKISV